MISFAGRCLAVLATPPHKLWSGRRDSNPRSRRWQRRVLAARRLPPSRNLGASSESRTRVIGLEARGTSRYTMLALHNWQGWQDSNLLELVLETSALPIGSSPLWRSQRELNPSLLIDSQASCRQTLRPLSIVGCEGTIRTCMNRFRAGDPGQLDDLAILRREPAGTVCFLDKRSNRSLHHSSNFSSTLVNELPPVPTSKLAAGERFERPYPDSKSRVLPLDDPASRFQRDCFHATHAQYR